MKKWFEVKALADAQSAEIAIHGEIGAWDMPAAKFIEQVKSLGNVAQINLSINSPGGSVFDALTMFNYLRRTGAEIIVRVDGIAASAASLLAMAGDKIIMPKNTMMMVHNPWTMAVGNAEELRNTADALDKVGEAIANTYQSRTGIDYAMLSEMLATDTWLTADEAMALGFATEVIDPILMQASCDVAALPELVRALYVENNAEVGPVEEDDQASDTREQAPDVPQTDLPEDSVDTDKLTAEAEQNALAYAKSVVELCAIAGMSGKAANFIQSKTSLADVRAKLLTAKANQQDSLDGTLPSPSTPKTWAEMSATERTVLYKSNPALAKQLQQVKA